MLFPAYWTDLSANDWYVIGLNYPGLANSGAGGYQLGPNPIMRHDVNRVTELTLRKLEEDFRRIREMGCRVVRMWAFTQGQGLRWTQDGTEDGETKWRVSGIDPAFCINVAAITYRAARQGIKIYWTLFIGGDFLIDTDEMPAREMKRAFHLILTDRTGHYRDPLIQTVIPNFLEALRPNLDGVFAVDIMNEPDVLWYQSVLGDIRELYGLENLSRTNLLNWVLAVASRYVPPVEDYLQFFTECSQQIRSHCQSWNRGASADAEHVSIPISVGCARYHSIHEYMVTIDSDLDFYDYHHYNHMDVSSTACLPLPEWNNPEKPCIIGECGLGGHLEFITLGASFGTAFRHSLPAIAALPDALLPGCVRLQELFDAQAECISNIMRRTYQLGYAGCLVWEYGKQYTNTRRPISPYNPRNLDDLADWGDRYHLIWNPHTQNRRIDSQYIVPMLVDGRIKGRKVVQVMNNIFQEHRNNGRCPPTDYIRR
jgi:hypothetical protein